MAMAFRPDRVDDGLLARVSFGDAWRALEDPSIQGTCDPFDVRQRMALYRLLIEHCNTNAAFGARDEHSPFWGYASQLAWQDRSGRLSGGSVPSSRIDEASWWGACNYALSVVPYEAAIAVGCVPTLRFEGPNVHPRGTYAEAMASWREAFDAMKQLRRGGAIEPIRFAVWRAHLTSIRAAVAASRAKFEAMSRTEQRFARGWVRMVDMFGIAALRTDLLVLAQSGGGALPHRMLLDHDADPKRCVLPRAEQRTMRHMFALADRTPWRWRFDLEIWRRIMRSRVAREDVDGVLAAMFGRSARAWRGRAKVAAYASLPVLVLDAVGDLAR
jgi:hypothetical protein